MSDTVLLVGARQGALAAAERLGLRILIATDKEPGPRLLKRIDGYETVDLSRPSAEIADRLGPLCDRHPPQAVIALTERSAVPAAELRRRLGLGGVSVQAARVCRDKVLMKAAAKAEGIPCAEYVAIDDATTADELVQRLSLPIIVKQRDASGGRGTRVCRTEADVAGAMHAGWMAEHFVVGREMSYETLTDRKGRRVFENPTEYTRQAWASLAPAPLDADTLAQVRALNDRVLDAFDVRSGITHLELFLTPSGPVFGEVAVRPPGGYLMDIFSRAYGFDVWEALLCVELGREVATAAPRGRIAGAWLFGDLPRGACERVEGLDAARAVDGVIDVACDLRAGKPVRTGEGSSRYCGRVLAEGASRADVVRSLEQARRKVRIAVDGRIHSASPEPEEPDRAFRVA